MNVHTAFQTLETLAGRVGTPADRRALATIHTQVDMLARQRSAFLELLAGLGVPDPAAYLAHDPATLRELGRCIFEKASGANPDTIRADERLHGAHVQHGTGRAGLALVPAGGPDE